MTQTQLLRILKKENDALQRLGFRFTDHPVRYYCTPKRALIFGEIGADGIHFCTVPGYGETVFMVCPDHFGGTCVYPAAADKTDFFRLLFTLRDTAHIEWVLMHPNREEYDSFLLEYPIEKEADEAAERLFQKTGLSPMEDGWTYLWSLQKTVDCSSMPFPKEYYEARTVPEAPPEVTLDVRLGCDWFGNNGSGEVLAPAFLPRPEPSETGWQPLAVYRGTEGVVVDLCIPYHKQTPAFPDRITAQCGEKEYRPSSGSMLITEEAEGRNAADLYFLAPETKWYLARISFRIPAAEQKETLTLNFIKRPKWSPAAAFRTGGQECTFTLPLDGSAHTLTVLGEDDRQETYPENPCYILPDRYRELRCRIDPPVTKEDVRIGDIAPGDKPMEKHPQKSCDFESTITAPVFYWNESEDGTVTVQSSPYFELPEKTVWQISVCTEREKTETINVPLR